MKRRALLGGLAGILASGFAPAFVGSSILMPVRKIITPLSDVDLIEQLRFSQEQIVRAFKIPPQMIELERAKMAAFVLISNELLEESLPVKARALLTLERTGYLWPQLT